MPDPLSSLSRAELLSTRICDLGVTFDDSPLAERFDVLLDEFEHRGLRFRPYAWLSTDWFAPDGLTGFAIPFYLASPRLVRLERSQMLDAEGAERPECMKLLRHEAAHAIDNAYGLRRTKRFREVFGRAGEAYRSSYTPDPTSRDYVLHLDDWYSQSHPLEDFAETFAVWLKPKSDWRKRYAGWPALKKLRYVDETMRAIADTPPKLRTRRREEPASKVRTTLAQYYEQKKRHYADEGTPALDGQLSRSFPTAEAKGQQAPKLATFLRKERSRLVGRVASATGQHRYVVDHVVEEMILRAKSRDLRLPGDEGQARLDAAILLTSLTSQFLYGGHARFQR